MLYKSGSVGMAGCCVGSDTQNCGWARSCVDYSAFKSGGCGGNCMMNSFVRKCTDAFSPYCVSFTYPSDSIADYGCAPSAVGSVYTVRQRATDDFSATTTITLSTLSGKAVTGFDASTAGGSQPTNDPYYDTPTHTAKKIAVGLIVVIVAVILVVIFVIVIGVIFCLKKKKKQQQIAANAQAVAAAQANRPQSVYPTQQPPMQQTQQPGGFVPPMPSQTPQPSNNGYFAPPGQNEQKPTGLTSAYEYPQTPISNPSTPAPAYSQPYGPPSGPPPVPSMPGQQNTQPYYSPPAGGVHEVGGGDVSRPSPQQGASPIIQPQAQNFGPAEVHATSAPSNNGPVFEMGSGR